MHSEKIVHPPKRYYSTGIQQKVKRNKTGRRYTHSEKIGQPPKRYYNIKAPLRTKKISLPHIWWQSGGC